MNEKPNVAVIVGSTRPGRAGAEIAAWVHEVCSQRDDARFELVDLADFHLPLLDEPEPAAAGNYANPHTVAWAAKMAEFDGYVLVTPEYNATTSAALKNALDYLWAEWQHKAATMVGYGWHSGVRAVESLRPVLSTLNLHATRNAGGVHLGTDFTDGTFTPAEQTAKSVTNAINQLIPLIQSTETLRK